MPRSDASGPTTGPGPRTHLPSPQRHRLRRRPVTVHDGVTPPAVAEARTARAGPAAQPGSAAIRSGDSDGWVKSRPRRMTPLPGPRLPAAGTPAPPPSVTISCRYGGPDDRDSDASGAQADDCGGLGPRAAFRVRPPAAASASANLDDAPLQAGGTVTGTSCAAAAARPGPPGIQRRLRPSRRITGISDSFEPTTASGAGQPEPSGVG